MLKRCLQGQTQNRNESVNGQLWSRCPKSKYCGKRRVVIAVCETVGVFNTGAANKANLMKSCGISPGRNMLKALRNEDKERILSAAHKVSSKYWKRRQEIRSKRKTKADKLSYQAGAFGTSSKPEADGKGKGKEKKKPPRKQAKTVSLPAEPATSEIEIMFVAPELEFVVAAPRKWSEMPDWNGLFLCFMEKTLEPSMWTIWTACIKLDYDWCLLREHLLFKDCIELYMAISQMYICLHSGYLNKHSLLAF